MIDNNKTPFYIISANVKGQTPAEAFNQSYSLKTHLNRKLITYKVVGGCFDGKREISFLITDFPVSKVLDIARKYRQKCILSVDRYREASLVYTKGASPKPLGWFMPGDSDDNYTIHEGTKYVCSSQ